jgi:hypothetical protein
MGPFYMLFLKMLITSSLGLKKGNCPKNLEILAFKK